MDQSPFLCEIEGCFSIYKSWKANRRRFIVRAVFSTIGLIRVTVAIVLHGESAQADGYSDKQVCFRCSRSLALRYVDEARL